MLTDQQIDRFVAKHRLPGRFRHLIDEYYWPLAMWVFERHAGSKTMLLGINGAQGSGKSTLADFLRLALESYAGWCTAVLSIDDFYLTRLERQQLADRVHPLLSTRGVPGTHDSGMLSECIESLQALPAGKELRLPRFDKSLDDRASPQTWPKVAGPVDVIILEGWCVGSAPQSDDDLRRAVNVLEKEQDSSGKWRRFVNEQLAGDYAVLFAQMDALVFLRVPEFDVVYRWRLEQEDKLAATIAGPAAGIMDKARIEKFVQHFERVTRENLRVLPATADVMLEFNDEHDCVRSRYPD